MAKRKRAAATAAPSVGASEHPNRGFPIVGIGASAGGLEAYRALLAHLPVDTGMGFVLVQHLDPAHESELSQLLARVTPLPVDEVTNNLQVEPNHVYVIPPNTNLSIAGGVLQLKPRSQSRTPARSIDRFFESLAEDQRERAIGVILSGTATDGTLGLEAIKAEGGITFAQDDSAKYDSMPRSAVVAGCVDFVLSPENIAGELARIAKHPYVVGQSTDVLTVPEEDRATATAHEDDASALPSGGHSAPRIDAERARSEAATAPAQEGDDGFKKVLLLLRNHSGVDFSLYKSATIQRRIARRMVLNKQNTPEQYAAFLGANAKELDALYSDVLISVTSFFRNPDAFDVLTRKVFPKLFEQRGDDPVRVWVLGCSTGQEAYSIAMAFVEAAEKAPSLRKLQVFATDLNEALLDKARHGLYAKSLAQDVTPERLRRFFVEEEGGYRISKALRDMIVFARQNVISDPPFSRMDLISCRNLLIYLDPSLQRKLLPMFHYALKPHGMLFLGASESIGGFTDLFEPADKKHRIYARKRGPTPAFRMSAPKPRHQHSSSGVPGLRAPLSTVGSDQPGTLGGFRAEINAQREADRVTVSQFAPPGVLINAELQILQFRGPTSAYLVPPTGKPSFDVLKMAREGLMLPLRAAINQAKKTNATARKENVPIAQNGGTRTVNLQVIPLKNLRERAFLILFEDAAETAPSARADRRPSTAAPTTRTAERAATKEASGLSRELSETREYMQSIQEQYEAANEELQASNEEVQSANEELQSINEELETSKEELESANEELTTVNEELANRNTELTRLNNDLINVQTSTNLAIVLLGRDLTIRRFNAQAGARFNLLATDLGRPLGGVRHDLDVPDLEAAITEVITHVRPWQRDVQDRTGRWYSLRLRPYLTLDNKVDGAVLLLVDVDDLKRSEQIATGARDYAEAILRTTRDPLLILNGDLRVHSANEAFYSLFHVSPAATEGHLIYELGNGAWNIPRLRELLEDVLPRNSVFDDFEVVHDFPALGRRTMLLNARTLRDRDGAPARILLGIQDITESLRLQAAARQGAARYQALVEASAQIVWTTDAGGVVVEDSPSWRAFTGQTDDQRKGFGWLDALHPDDRQRVRELWLRAVSERVPMLETEYRVRRATGDWRWTVVRAVPVLNIDGSVHEWVGMNIDVTERKQAEEARRESEQRLTIELAATQQLQAASALLIEAGNADSLYQKSVDAAAAIMRSDYASMHMLHSERGSEGELHLLAHRGFSPEAATFWEWVRPADQSTCSMAVRRGQRVVVPDVETCDFMAGSEDLESCRQAGIRAVQSTPLFSRGGRLLGVLSTHWNTPHTPTETDLALFDILARLSADLLERKLAEQALREADIHKNEFLAMLAHELRNPLAPIRNALQIIRLAGADQAAVHAASEVMERQVGHMVRLIDDLLEVSRISLGRIDLHKESVELVSIVHHATEAAVPLCASMDQELTVTVPPEPLYVHGDAFRLIQVIGNLLNNASKFTDRGGHISVTLDRQADQAVIRVRDTGIGIPADHLTRIFEMFTQVDTALERSHTGLGIGLALVKTLVQMHDGTVDAQSAGAGQGSEFSERLPLLINPAQSQASSQLSPGAKAQAPRRILVVDDNRDAAQSLAILLQLRGHEVHLAYDGLQAVETAEGTQPDVVLLDIGLPKLNGYEVARRIREHSWGKSMTLVALTGWGQEEDLRRSAEAGFTHHLVKPVDLVAVIKVLGAIGTEIE